MKKYVVSLDDELATIYEDIAKMNKKAMSHAEKSSER